MAVQRHCGLDGAFDEVTVVNGGSVFQLVSWEYLESLRDRRFFRSHLKSLGRYEPDMDAAWYMKRGARYWPWWVLWQLSTVVEWVVWRFLKGAWKTGFVDVPEGLSFSWSCWRWKWWKEKGVSDGGKDRIPGGEA